MKRMGKVLGVVLLAATLLSGCVVVPYGGWGSHGGYYGGGGYHRHYGGGPYRGGR